MIFPYNNCSTTSLREIDSFFHVSRILVLALVCLFACFVCFLNTSLICNDRSQPNLGNLTSVEIPYWWRVAAHI